MIRHAKCTLGNYQKNGESREGYWIADTFINQLHSASKYLRLIIQRAKVIACYGHLITAVAMLPWQMILYNVSKTNVTPGGKRE